MLAPSPSYRLPLEMDTPQSGARIRWKRNFTVPPPWEPALPPWAVPARFPRRPGRAG